MMIIVWIALPLAGLILGWMIRWLYAKFQLTASEQRAERLKREAVREAEAKRKELELEAKAELMRMRETQERELRERRKELDRIQRRLDKKEEIADQKVALAEKQKHQYETREQGLEQLKTRADVERRNLQEQLEHVSGLTREEAKELIISSLENEARHEAEGAMRKIEREAEQNAERTAREILVSTIQRMTSEVSTEIMVSSVTLPNDDMKGRIIGRDGRNIRALETATGADIVIDDTPEAVVVSCFDPVRKEIARRSLERLIIDGRIHPGRIEDIVRRVTADVGKIIFDEGEQILYEIGIHDMPPEGITAIGRLHFRTSYGQNVLAHSKEVATLAGMLARELKANSDIAKRGAILHDVGKAIEANDDSTHVELGVDLAKRLGESDEVINCIAAHHGDVPYSCVESVIVQIADALSASRPGARRESLDNYIKRLENLEQIAEGFNGVERAYAIQAGRELRVLVNHEEVNDEEAQDIAHQIARRIEGELRYPGRIKLTLIREARIIEYAR